MSDRQGKLMVLAAEPEHAFSIYKTLLKALDQAGTQYPPPDMPYCIQAMLDLIAQGLVGVAVIRKWGEDRVVGVIALDSQRWPWCHPQNQSAIFLFNQHFWIEPEYRKGGTASKLIDFATGIADQRNITLRLIFTNIMGEAAPLRDRFARIKGFVYTGGDFIRAPKPVA